MSDYLKPGDVSQKTYYIHPAAFGGTKDPGHGHVPVVKADGFEKLRAKLEAAEKRTAELEARTVTLPPKEHDNGTDSQIDINAGFANRMWQKFADAIRAAGIGVKGE